MSDPTTPTREELSRIAGGDHRLLIALERLFFRVGVEMDEGSASQAVQGAAMAGKVGAARALAEAAVVASLAGGDSKAVRHLAEAAMVIAMMPDKPENLAKDYIDLRISPSAASERRLVWGENTASLGLLNSVTLQIGQQIYVYGLNSSGVSINKGQGVMEAGLSGGDLLLARSVSNGTVEGYRMLGIAAQDIADGEYGYVIRQGMLDDVNTSAFTAGDWLYFSSAVPGVLTATQPAKGKLKAARLKVLVSDISGSVYVQMQDDLKISDLTDVDSDPATNDHVLTYDSTSDTWSGEALPAPDLSSSNLEALQNVAGGSPSLGDALSHNGTQWGRLSGASGAFGASTGETVTVTRGIITSIV